MEKAMASSSIVLESMALKDAGSAIQVAMMEHLSKHPEAREGMVPTLVFVHAVNPYGMRTTEDSTRITWT